MSGVNPFASSLLSWLRCVKTIINRFYLLTFPIYLVFNEYLQPRQMPLYIRESCKSRAFFMPYEICKAALCLKWQQAVLKWNAKAFLEMPQSRLEMLSENPRAYLSFEIWIKVLLENRGAFFVYIRIEKWNCMANRYGCFLQKLENNSKIQRLFRNNPLNFGYKRAQINQLAPSFITRIRLLIVFSKRILCKF